MYQFKKSIHGIDRETRLYKTWTGYSHPITPVAPVNFEEVQSLKVYYEASYEPNAAEELLIAFEKLEFIRETVVPDHLPATCHPGENFHTFARKHTGKVTAEAPLRPDTVVRSKEYFRIVLTPDGDLALAEIIRREFVFSYEYEYDTGRKLIRAVIKNTLGTKVLTL